MGTFISLSSVVGKTQNEVVNSLTNYANSVDGGLLQSNINYEHKNFCVVEEGNGNTSIFYPSYFLDWDNVSAYISKELQSPTFSFHIHDGDFWMYTFYLNGDVLDQYLPIPDYWDDIVSEDEIKSWQGNAAIISKYVPNVRSSDIEKYLIRWNLDNEPEKAYPNDLYQNEEWQLLDFMRKLKLPYPLDDNNNPKGVTYELWIKEVPLK